MLYANVNQIFKGLIMQDIKIVCKGCGKEFIFTAGDQEFYKEKAFSNPVRCKDCREKKKAEKNAQK